MLWGVSWGWGEQRVGRRGDIQLQGAGGADGVNGCLVVGEDEVGVHVVGLVHKAKDDLLVVHEAVSKLTPEFTKLLGGCGSGVGGVADNASGHGLLGWVVVAHVVVRVQDAVGALGDGDVVHGVFDLGEVLLGGQVRSNLGCQ